MTRIPAPRVHVALVAIGLLALGQLGCVENAGCSDEQAKSQIAALFESLYLFNDEPAQAAKYDSFDPPGFSSIEALLEALRYLPDQYDRYFSYVTTPEAEQEFLAAGTYVGFGVMLDDRTTGELGVRGVFAGSPADLAGLERGDRILEIDGRTIGVIDAAEGVDVALGPSERGVVREFLIRPVVGGADFLVPLTKEIVEIDPVPFYDVFDVGGEKVGYLVLHSFIEPAVPALFDAFEDFQSAGITRLVLDLRYNGGGLLHLAATINDILGGWAPDTATGGLGNVGKVQYSRRYNSQNARFDMDETFYDDDLKLPLETIVFITTDETASASELLINALGPYREVFVVGQPTFGKPVGQEARDFCGGTLRLRLVTFDLVNALGEGEYYDGLPVDCEASDDLGAPLGSVAEASLGTALAVATTGVCPEAPAAASVAAPRRAAPVLGPGAFPWLAAY